MAVGEKLETLLEEPEAFPDFEFLSYWQTQFNAAIAVTVFMAWVKVKETSRFEQTEICSLNNYTMTHGW